MKLKNCPLCEGVAYLGGSNATYYWVECLDCGIKLEYFDNKKIRINQSIAIINNWNRNR